MNGSLTCEGVLLARTVPEETKDGDVTVCSAWWIPSLGGFVRIYPLPIKSELRAWNQYELRLTKSNKDSRWRSFKLAEEAPRLVRRGNREDLRAVLESAAIGTTVKRLNEQRDSMGILRPAELELVFEYGQADLTHSFGRRTFDVRPRLQFRDVDGDHNLGLNEYGCFEWLRKGNAPEALRDNLRLDYPDREQLLLVGNLRDHRNAWVVIAVVGYGAKQASLFRNVPDEQRGRIFERDDFTCQNCGAKDSLTIDHIIPVSRGGDNSDENLRVLCLQCQCRKNDRLDSEWPEMAGHA